MEIPLVGTGYVGQVCDNRLVEVGQGMDIFVIPCSAAA